jgi:hypothetical protein
MISPPLSCPAGTPASGWERGILLAIASFARWPIRLADQACIDACLAAA